MSIIGFVVHDAWNDDTHERMKVYVLENHTMWDYLDVELYDRVLRFKRDKDTHHHQLLREVMFLQWMSEKYGIPHDLTRYIAQHFIVRPVEYDAYRRVKSDTLRYNVYILWNLLTDILWCVISTIKYVFGGV